MTNHYIHLINYPLSYYLYIILHSLSLLFFQFSFVDPMIGKLFQSGLARLQMMTSLFQMITFVIILKF